MSYEKLTIVGNLGADPDMKYTKDGTEVTNLSVAVNKKRKDGQKTTTWYQVSVFGKSAENAAKYLKKGSKVLAECSNLRVNLYTREDGKPDASLDVTADRVVFLDSAPEDETDAGEAPGSDEGEQAREAAEADIPL